MMLPICRISSMTMIGEIDGSVMCHILRTLRAPSITAAS